MNVQLMGPHLVAAGGRAVPLSPAEAALIRTLISKPKEESPAATLERFVQSDEYQEYTHSLEDEEQARRVEMNKQQTPKGPRTKEEVEAAIHAAMGAMTFSEGTDYASKLQRVFDENPSLYEEYRHAKPGARKVEPEPARQLGPVEAEIERRLGSENFSEGMTRVDRLCELFRRDPDLYRRYTDEVTVKVGAR